MATSAHAACPSLDAPPISAERRASVRYSCDLETSCQPIAAARSMTWSGRILNISQGGICLSIGRRFEVKTLLAIELPAIDGNTPCSCLARVVHVRAQDCGSWLLGCAFISPLAANQVEALTS